MQELPCVFIVDDDLAARDSVAAMVTAKGLPTRCYPSAQAFLDDFDPSRWGCLVSDVRMDGMSGVQLQQKLCRDGVTLPIILISGYADIPTAVHTMRTGAVTFLEKPCREEDLWSNICRAIEWHRKRRESQQLGRRLQERFARLTHDECEVMRAMVAGKPNKVIASELQIGLRTVELRRANVLKKTEADSLAELVKLTIIHDRLNEAAPVAGQREMASVGA